MNKFAIIILEDTSAVVARDIINTGAMNTDAQVLNLLITSFHLQLN